MEHCECSITQPYLNIDRWFSVSVWIYVCSCEAVCVALVCVYVCVCMCVCVCVAIAARLLSWPDNVMLPLSEWLQLFFGSLIFFSIGSGIAPLSNGVPGPEAFNHITSWCFDRSYLYSANEPHFQSQRPESKVDFVVTYFTLLPLLPPPRKKNSYVLLSQFIADLNCWKWYASIESLEVMLHLGWR